MGLGSAGCRIRTMVPKVAPLVEQGVLADPIRLQDLFSSPATIGTDRLPPRWRSGCSTRNHRMTPASGWPRRSSWAEPAGGSAGTPAHLGAWGRRSGGSTRVCPQAEATILNPWTCCGVVQRMLRFRGRAAGSRAPPAQCRRWTSAEATFRELAAVDGPKGIDTRELLYLWGPQGPRYRSPRLA